MVDPPTPKMAEVLICNKADVNAVDMDESTALMFAPMSKPQTVPKWGVVRDRSELIDVLAQCGAVVKRRGSTGCTPLVMVAIMGTVGLAKALVRTGAALDGREFAGYVDRSGVDLRLRLTKPLEVEEGVAVWIKIGRRTGADNMGQGFMLSVDGRGGVLKEDIIMQNMGVKIGNKGEGVLKGWEGVHK